MMDSPNLVILDVGHGNCAVLKDMDSTIIVDCALGATLIDLLDAWDIRRIPYILISHADEDHIAGVTALLLKRDISVGNVYLNSDSKKRTAIWYGLRTALADAHNRAGTLVQIGLTPLLTGQLNVGQTQIEILAPSELLAMTGVGGEDLHHRELSANSMSAVIGLVHNGHRVAILPGDIDELGLNDLLQTHNDLRAEIIVFPHHGGKPGKGDALTFAKRLSEAVKPNLVVFSNGRGRLGNPQPQVVQGIRIAAPDSHIVCTQLSKNCSSNFIVPPPSHILNLPSLGRITNSCCGGSILIHLDGSNTTYSPSLSSHASFVTSRVPSPVCLRRF